MVKVVDSTEKNKRVFKKPQENREDESYFYNEKYFADIGFPGTKVYEGEMSADGAMRGGYYKHPDLLTDPFRRFVKIVQRDKEEIDDEQSDEDGHYLGRIGSAEDAKSVATEDGSKKDTPGFFSRLGEYGSNINNYVKTTADKISPYFQTKPVEIDETKLESDAKPATEPGSINKKYWVVKIPIVKDEEFTPKGKYEKAETKMNQILREEKVDKKLGKSKIGEMYDVGSKYVRMCEGVKEWERYEIDDIKLPGSKMEKIKSQRSP